MTARTILILGARSDMARAIARRFAAAGYDIQLAARRSSGLQDDCADIALRHGVSVSHHEFDVLAIDTHADFVGRLSPLPDVAVCCVGYMGDQAQSERDMTAAAIVLRSNFEGPACILGALAEAFVDRGHGTLVGISSVAGERGRASNYVYGAAKAGFTAFLSGLRNRLAGKNIGVVTVLPGFVNTAMTQGMTLPPKLTAEPVEVADAIYTAVDKKRDVIYVRRIWRPIMLAIRNIPERLFKRMSL